MAAGAVLLALAVVVVLERVRTYDEPLERDAAGYAVIGHEINRGRALYADLWERKPPLLYATFAAAERLFGYGPGEVFAVNVTAALATLAAVAAAGRRGGVAGSLIAAGLWAFVGGDLLAQANQPNAEVFVNAGLTAAFAVLVAWPRRPDRRWAAVLAVGGLSAFATLYKQHAVVVVAMLLLGHVAVGPAERRGPVRRRVIDAAVAAGVVAVVWAGLLGYFAAVGRLHDAVDAMVWQNLAYAGGGGGGPLDHLLAAVTPTHLLTPILLWAIAPAAVVAVAAVVNGRRTISPHWRLWLFWAAGAWGMVVAPGYFLAHYYQLLMPPLCVAGGWAAAGLLRRPGVLPRVAVVAALVAVVVRQGSQYRLSPERWARDGFADVPYFDNDFARHRAVGRQLDALLRPGETFWNLGEDNTLYFASGRSPPVGLLYLDPVVVGPDIPGHWRRLMADLDRAPPDLIVVSTRTVKALAPTAPLFPWMRAHYAVAHTGDLGRPTYQIFVRRGTDLYRRLNGAGKKRAESREPRDES